MSAQTALLVLFAALLHASWNTIVKGGENKLYESAMNALGGGLCGLGSYGIAIWAMSVAPIALVAALRETSVVFGMLLAVLFLGERFSRPRALAVLLVAAGGMLLKAG